MSRNRKIVLLGATGSIGQSAMKVARAIPDRMEIVGMSANRNIDGIIAAAREFKPKLLCIGDKNDAERVRQELGSATKVVSGAEGLVELATLESADMVLIAIVGTAGLAPSLAAIEAGKDLAVASKEILVAAGEIVMAAAAKKGVQVLPVDSEHNAIFQCLGGRTASGVRRLILTCSGGPFRTTPAAELEKVTPEMALRHPTWTMGRKITIDSASLFNKGLEMIEAHSLFGISMDKVDVVIHPQSIVHSLVEFVDGSMLAQMSHTDMCFPIQYAVTWPERLPSMQKALDLAELGKLDFERPREEDFPALGLSREAGLRGGTLPAVLNAANEVAVEAFLDRRIAFPKIWSIVEHAMQKTPFVASPTLEEILQADAVAREVATSLVGK
ncbi:MAG: 1-deoxy-D-xylulose-5-phosphate reductoisomerase [Chthoniobacterales bacterium]